MGVMMPHYSVDVNSVSVKTTDTGCAEWLFENAWWPDNTAYEMTKKRLKDLTRPTTWIQFTSILVWLKNPYFRNTATVKDSYICICLIWHQCDSPRWPVQPAITVTAAWLICRALCRWAWSQTAMLLIHYSPQTLFIYISSVSLCLLAVVKYSYKEPQSHSEDPLVSLFRHWKALGAAGERRLIILQDALWSCSWSCGRSSTLGKC